MKRKIYEIRGKRLRGKENKRAAMQERDDEKRSKEGTEQNRMKKRKGARERGRSRTKGGSRRGEVTMGGRLIQAGRVCEEGIRSVKQVKKEGRGVSEYNAG